MSDYPLLTRDDQIVALAEQLAQTDRVAVDLEADSMHSYREKICLVQITYGEETCLIDPLGLTSLDPLKPILADPKVRKVFHAADYDLRCLHRDFDITINGLFDTLICAQFCGEEKIGLADLLGKYFNVQLDKRFQRADWSRRPLSEEMLAYAAEDTNHLFRLAELLEARLMELGRWEWAVEEFGYQEQVQFAVNGGPLFQRIKGAGRLDRRQLGTLEQLLQWRETEAEHRDCPPFKVIGNRELLALAQTAPTSPQGLKRTEGLSPRHIDRLGKKLLAVIQKALAIPEAELPTFPRQAARFQRDPKVDARFDALKKWRKAAAAELALDPGVLINNALLEELARVQPKTAADLEKITAMKNWQRRALGAGILDQLR